MLDVCWLMCWCLLVIGLLVLFAGACNVRIVVLFVVVCCLIVYVVFVACWPLVVVCCWYLVDGYGCLLNVVWCLLCVGLCLLLVACFLSFEVYRLLFVDCCL